MELQQENVIESRQFIGGEWVDAAAGATFDDLDPFTGDVVARVPAGTREDAARAVEAAHEAFAAWSQTPPAARQGIFLKAADALEARQDEVVSLLARETGCTFGFAMFQTHFVPGLLRQAAALAYAPLGEILPSDTGAFSMGLRRPVGVVGAIAPVERGADPVRAVDRGAARPREHRRPEAVRALPVVGGLLWGEIFTEAGLPPGVLNIVTHAPGEAGPIGDELVENPHVRRLNFTGSTETGRKLAEAAGRNLKRIVLELGGYNPLIVLADADLEYAVDADDLRRVPAPGPDLHVSAEDHRRAADRGRVRRAADREDEDTQGRRPEGARHDHRAADHRGRAATGLRPGRGRGREGRTGARRRRGRRPVLPGDAPRRRPCGRGVRAAGDVRASRGDRDRRLGRRGRGVRERDQVRPRLRHPDERRRSRPRARPADRGRASSTSTTSRSATSRRCRSAASRTAASAVSAARRWWTSSPRSAG